MKESTLDFQASKKSEPVADIIKQMTDDGVQIETILSIGNLSTNGVIKTKFRFADWFMLAQLTHGLHIVLNQSFKTDKKFNKSIFRKGLMTVVKKVDSFHKAHPEVLLINDLSGDDVRFNLGFVGLMRNYPFYSLSVECKNLMYYISKACQIFITELIKPEALRDDDMTDWAIDKIDVGSSIFHNNSKGATLFLDMNQPQ